MLKGWFTFTNKAHKHLIKYTWLAYLFDLASNKVSLVHDIVESSLKLKLTFVPWLTLLLALGIPPLAFDKPKVQRISH